MTDQTMSAPAAQQFTIGHVLGTSFAVLGRNIVPFVIIAILISIPSFIVSRIVPIDVQIYQNAASQQQHLLYFYSLGSKASWINTGASLITSSLITAALVYGTFQHLRGQRAAMGLDYCSLSTRSVCSHGNSGFPKWPFLAVWV